MKEQLLQLSLSENNYLPKINKLMSIYKTDLKTFFTGVIYAASLKEFKLTLITIKLLLTTVYIGDLYCRIF